MMRWRGPRSVIVPSVLLLVLGAAAGVFVAIRHPAARHLAIEIDREAFRKIVRTLIEQVPRRSAAAS